jgi:meiosis induction protein kinase IME2/SME1
MVVDQQSSPVTGPKSEVYESLDKALRDVQNSLEGRPALSNTQSTTNLKRHHSLPQQHTRSVDNLIGAARTGPISSRTRRAQAAQGVQQYEAPDEEDELLDEAASSSTQRAMKRMEGNNAPRQLRQSASNIGITNPYPTPSPSASGNQILFNDGQSLTPKPLDLHKKAPNQYKWPTPPYEESEWAASASASIWAASNKF